MKPIEQLLRREIGLDAASVGSTLIERAVRLRMKSHGLKHVAAYRRLLVSCPAELNELIESVIVAETWFFREGEPFAALVRLARELTQVLSTARPLRLLSVPCSSGEEPYSMAMALLDEGVPPERFQIDAADVSARALARAQRAIYGKNSFRVKDLAFRTRYFQPTKEGFALNASVRNRVRFYQANLLKDNFPAGPGTYDFIFCRNLLIYFDRPAQQKGLETIHRLLMPGGVLFVGPAEQPLAAEFGFIPADIPMAFACRKTSLALAPAERLPGWTRTAKMPGMAAALPGGRPLMSSFRFSQAGPPLPLSARAELEKASRLADTGHLEEAAEICEACLRQDGVSAQAYYLLGLVCEARADGRAIDCYRKALYLDPSHYESLLQMALLAQKNGEPTRARAFRERALRARAAA